MLGETKGVKIASDFSGSISKLGRFACGDPLLLSEMKGETLSSELSVLKGTEWDIIEIIGHE